MRVRMMAGSALLCLIALASPMRADEAKAGKAGKAAKPGVVIRLRPIANLLEDFKYLAKMAGKESEADQFEQIIKDKKDESGIALDRPVGAYGQIGPAGIDSTLVVLVPIADEKVFVDFLKNFIKAEKGADGIYEAEIENVPVPVYFTFANKYAYVTARDKDPLAKDKLLKPTDVLPEKQSALLSISANIDQIPEGLRNTALGALDLHIAKAKKENKGGETKTQIAFKEQLLDEIGRRLASLVKEGGAVEFSVNLDRKADEMSVQVSLAGMDDTKLAASIADLAASKSLFAGLATKNSAFSGLIHFVLPEKLRNAVVPVLDEIADQVVKKETDDAKKKHIEAAIKTLLPTAKAGELDVAIDLRGPSAKKLYTGVGAAKIQDGEAIDKLARQFVAGLPAEQQAVIKFDADKAGQVAIHKLDVGKFMDEEGKKFFGDGPLYVAFRSDAVLVAVGENALDAIKEAAAATPKAARPLSFEVSLARLAPLMVKDAPTAPKIAEEVFGEKPGTDKVRVSVEGGKAMTLRFAAKTQALQFFAKIEEAKKARR